jgi:hypothetical protein
MATKKSETTKKKTTTKKKVTRKKTSIKAEQVAKEAPVETIVNENVAEIVEEAHKEAPVESVTNEGITIPAEEVKKETPVETIVNIVENEVAKDETVASEEADETTTSKPTTHPGAYNEERTPEKTADESNEATKKDETEKELSLITRIKKVFGLSKDETNKKKKAGYNWLNY